LFLQPPVYPNRKLFELVPDLKAPALPRSREPVKDEILDFELASLTAGHLDLTEVGYGLADLGKHDLNAPVAPRFQLVKDEMPLEFFGAQSLKQLPPAHPHRPR